MSTCRYNLAMAQRMTGDLEAAEKNLDEVIAARPDDAETYNSRSDLRRQTSERNHVRQLETALHRIRDRRSSLAVSFALAKASRPGFSRDTFEVQIVYADVASLPIGGLGSRAPPQPIGWNRVVDESADEFEPVALGIVATAAQTAYG